jgi:hypothetical protein
VGNTTTWRDSSLSSAALERNELIVGKFENRIRAVQLHSIRSSGTHRLSHSGRWQERLTATCRFTPSHTINSVRSVACELRRRSRRVVGD